MKTENNKVSAQNILSSGTFLQWIILIAISIVFTISLYPNLVADKKTYDLGDVAEKDIKAPRDFFIEDKDATEEKRNSAMEGILTVYDHDTKLSTQISERIDTAFSDLRTLIQTEKATYRKTVSELFDMNTSGLANLNKRIHDQIWEKKPAFEEKIGIPVSKGAYTILEKEAFSKDISDLIIKILSTVLENGVVLNKELFLRESDKGISLWDVETRTEQVLKNLRQYYGLDQSKTMVRIVGQPLLKNLNYTLLNLIVDFSL